MPLIPMPTTREEWLKLRGRYIGASEIAALYGVQADYQQSLYTLWHTKSGRVPSPPVEGPRIKWGLRLEEVIAMAVGEENNWTITKGRYAYDDEYGIGASLDFEADTESGIHGVLETKNVDWLVHKRSWDEEPPIHISLQFQAQLAVTGFEWGCVAALIGGNELKLYPFSRRDSLIEDMRNRARDFWRSVRENTPPPVDGTSGASHVLREMFPALVDDAIDMRNSNEWPEACADFLQASETKKAAEKAYDLAKNRVAALLGEHKRGWGAGFSASVVVTPAKPDRLAEPGEVISGRKEARRYVIKEQQL